MNTVENNMKEESKKQNKGGEMKLGKKIEETRRIIARTKDLEAYPSTVEEILASYPDASFPESEKLEQMLKRAIFYQEFNRRKSHYILDKILRDTATTPEHQTTKNVVPTDSAPTPNARSLEFTNHLGFISYVVGFDSSTMKQGIIDLCDCKELFSNQRGRFFAIKTPEEIIAFNPTICLGHKYNAKPFSSISLDGRYAHLFQQKEIGKIVEIDNESEEGEYADRIINLEEEK